MQHRSSDGRPRGFILLATALVIFFLIPVVGLSVDAGVLYLVKTKLSMAVDAGALAGARALSRGVSNDQQIASAQDTARAYVRANFPTNFLPDTNLTIAAPNVDLSVENRRSVTVSANVDAPLYFMKVFGMNSTRVAASGTAVRRDVNVAVVLDRSGSLQNSGSCEAVKANAASFVNRFSEGRDNVGLVTFATSSRDDFQLASNFQTATPNVVDIVNSVVCTGGTNSAQGLWQGYKQLVALNEPNALNAILFFTDGQPTAFSGQFKIKLLSTCLDKATKTAVLTVAGNSTNIALVNYGLLKHLAPAQPMASDLTIADNSGGCGYSLTWPTSATLVGNDVQKLPVIDIHGNKLITGYQPVTGATPTTGSTAGLAWDTESTADLSPANIHAAAINAADDAGLRIRHGETVQELGRGLEGVVVFSIGLGNASGGIEQDFMRRVSNDVQASNYDAAKPTGMFLYAPQTSDLAQAFNRIASEILRLAK